MPPFDQALRSAAAALDLPQPDRARILEEIAVDLQELKAELVRRGFPEPEAESRAVELLAPSEVAVQALVDVHEPLYRSLERRFSPSVPRRSERATVLLVTVGALAAVVVPLARSALPRDPSPFIFPIFALLAGVVALTGQKAIQLYSHGDHTLVSGGIKVALTTTIYGMLTLLGGALLWFGLRQWHYREAIPET